MLKSLFKKYIGHYENISIPCWQRIGLRAISDLSAGVSFFLVLYFTHFLHFSLSKAGFVMGFYGIGTICSSFISGKLSDRYSPQPISILLLLLKSITFFLLIFSQQLPTITLTVFLFGFTDYGFNISNSVWLLENCSQNQSGKLKILNLLSSASNFGMALAIFLSSLLFSYFKLLFWILGFLIFASAIFLIKNNTTQTNKIIHKLDDETRLVQKTSTFFSMLFVLFCIMVIGMMFAQIKTIYVVYLHHAFPTINIHFISATLTLNLILVIFFQTPLSTFFNRYNKIMVMGSGSLLIGIGMSLLANTSSFIFPLISCLLYTIGEILFFPAAQLLCYENAGYQKKGFSMSLFYIVYSISLIIGSVSSGYCLEYTTHSQNVWMWCFYAGIFCFLLSFLNKKQPHIINCL